MAQVLSPQIELIREVLANTLYQDPPAPTMDSVCLQTTRLHRPFDAPPRKWQKSIYCRAVLKTLSILQGYF